MNFLIAEKFLRAKFENNQFEEKLISGHFHSVETVVQKCSDQSEVICIYPGYKAKRDGRGLVYDYRVDLKTSNLRTALSHVNIVVDIYNKITAGNMSYKSLAEVLVEVFMEGNIDLDLINSKLPYKPINPDKKLLEAIEGAHGRKKYNISGNLYDLTIEQLLASIKWIVLQEDINYPISRGFEGRKMPFARYMEAIFVAQSDKHSLSEVVERALAHYRPKQWSEMNYGFLQNIR